MSVTYGETIRAARVAKRMTLRALARALAVSAPYISDVEHDRRKLSGENEAKVSRLLGINADDLLNARMSRDLKEWLRRNPESFAALLRDLADSREPRGTLRIGGEDCPCRKCR